MEINVREDQGRYLVGMEGRLDTNTAPEMEKSLEKYYTMNGFDIVLDFINLDFVSSAGLRVILLIQKKAKALKGKLVIKNVKPEIQEVFDMTGFTDILTIEKEC
jgi:anti-anti-sigma factor